MCVFAQLWWIRITRAKHKALRRAKKQRNPAAKANTQTAPSPLICSRSHFSHCAPTWRLVSCLLYLFCCCRWLCEGDCSLFPHWHPGSLEHKPLGPISVRAEAVLPRPPTDKKLSALDVSLMSSSAVLHAPKWEAWDVGCFSFFLPLSITSFLEARRQKECRCSRLIHSEAGAFLVFFFPG